MNGISHQYGALTALSNLTLSVPRGQVVCLLGPSGCGKSTALRLAAGLEVLQNGEIKVAGRPVADAISQEAPENRGVGLVFQDYALFPHLSVLENVEFGLKSIDRHKRQERAVEMLERVKMDSFLHAFPHTLSGGQQQRVALARALAPTPQVMLLDEPYSGLDARLRDEVRDEVLHLLKTTGCSTLMVTHDSEEAMFMADQIVVMDQGRVVQSGTPTELYCFPISSFVAGFFSELNHLRGIVKGDEVHSKLGRIPVNNFMDGDKVEITIRPEALRLSKNSGKENSQLATVVESRLLGRTSLIHLSFPWPVTETDEQIHLHARVPGVMLPKPGEILSIDVDLSQTFVFPDR